MQDRHQAAIRSALHAAAQDLVARGTSHADAQHQALGVIEQLVQQQASLLSYMDVFRAFAIVSFCMVFVALLLVRNILLRDPGQALVQPNLHDA